MSEGGQSPVLVHNRIEKNHRNTIILLALVPLLLLPFAASLAVWLAPWVLIEGMIAHRPIAERWLGTSLESWFGTDPLWAELRLVSIAAGIVLPIMTVVTLVAALLYRHVILGTGGTCCVTGRANGRSRWTHIRTVAVKAPLRAHG